MLDHALTIQNEFWNIGELETLCLKAQIQSLK